jgi:alkanesulfonate monooxygenase SsuD/methylene tetrahydromethanopterin reductase-like flavin-dependent oxidoreductase (luciferase family)
VSAAEAVRRPFRLGFMSHVSGEADPATVLEQTTRLFIIAEELGFDSAWVAQHHVGAECGHLPSPFVLLAAVAARTSRIRLGTAVVTLPLEDPIRTAEDAAVADLISGGRIELGVGTCGHQPSFEALGRDFESRGETQRQSLATLTSALRGEPLPGRARLAPHAPGLADRIWQATSSAESAVAAAKARRGLLLARAAPRTGEPVAEVQLPIAQAYYDVFGSCADVGGHDGSARVGITRTVYPAADRETAIRHLEAGTRQWSLEMLPGLYPASVSAEDLFEKHSIYAGPKDEVAERLAADRAVRLATDLLIQVQPGLPTFGQTVAALETIATEIAPSLGWRPIRRR